MLHGNSRTNAQRLWKRRKETEDETESFQTAAVELIQTFRKIQLDSTECEIFLLHRYEIGQLQEDGEHL
ncbi:hypothetical protein MtrunA17_Chr5g0405251 [Medicago truncatula]|uniref:Uncharacterized protein n=1 Tax=Medicago truncatula TaxID=3880 RepID=A0A396HSD6_MEDTR|nr:hypothetical protein MtrunA17_Chr5g0405251 [Medicago truncatula]